MFGVLGFHPKNSSSGNASLCYGVQAQKTVSDLQTQLDLLKAAGDVPQGDVEDVAQLKVHKSAFVLGRDPSWQTDRGGGLGLGHACCLSSLSEEADTTLRVSAKASSRPGD